MPIVDWYPYPFLDARKLGSDGVALPAVFLLEGDRRLVEREQFVPAVRT